MVGHREHARGHSGYLVKIGTLMILRQVFIPNISNLQNHCYGDFWKKKLQQRMALFLIMPLNEPDRLQIHQTAVRVLHRDVSRFDFSGEPNRIRSAMSSFFSTEAARIEAQLQQLLPKAVS